MDAVAPHGANTSLYPLQWNFFAKTLKHLWRGRLHPNLHHSATRCSEHPNRLVVRQKCWLDVQSKCQVQVRVPQQHKETQVRLASHKEGVIVEEQVSEPVLPHEAGHICHCALGR
jgi:hypothetical protein